MEEDLADSTGGSNSAWTFGIWTGTEDKDQLMQQKEILLKMMIEGRKNKWKPPFKRCSVAGDWTWNDDSMDEDKVEAEEEWIN